MVSIIQIVTEDTTEYGYDPIYTYQRASDITSGIMDAIAGGNDDDITGVMTRGRFFIHNNQPLIKTYIERIMSKYDMIIPFESTVKAGDDGPKRIFEPGALIAERLVLRRFYEYAIDRLGDLEDETAVAGLLKTWIKDNHLKVKSEAVSKDDPQIWNNGYKKIELLQQYIDTLLKDYIYLRQQSGFEDCFAPGDPYEGDFDGKTPVWICWWQGIESAPPLIRSCIQSVERNLPEGAVLVPVTLDNWHEYVTLTDVVIDKFNRGIINYTKLANVLRSELLYRYGGVWIDATYYVSGNIPDWILTDSLYSTRFDPPLWGGDVIRGRWNTSLLAAQKHDVLMQFLMESWWLYWESVDELPDYFIFDYLIDAGYRHFEMIRNEIDSIRLSPPSVYELQLKMNQRISETEVCRLKETGLFYKINRRGDYREKTEHGFTSVFGYIMNEDVPDADRDVPVMIPVHSEKELVNAIREVNPEVIYDADTFFEDQDYISRGILDDIIIHDMKIYKASDCIAECDERFGVYDGARQEDKTMMPVAVITIDDKYSLKCF